MSYTVKKIADMAGISVRTLHHYDQIGVLKAAGTSAAGYRLYSDADLQRLQEILFFRELGFDLREVKAIIDSPAHDRTVALRSHGRLLREKRKRIDRLIRTVDATIESLEGGPHMDAKDMFNGFDDATIEEYKKEARERWGHTDAYRESEKRTARYTKADWERIHAESGDIYQRIAHLMEAGKKPDDKDVQDQTARWCGHITRWFYTCTPEIFRGLADGYVADDRFTANIDKVKPGLARFLSRAMKIYADALEASAVVADEAQPRS